MQDQYINHIMNETGATVILKGRGSGNFESPSSGGTFWLHAIFLQVFDFYYFLYDSNGTYLMLLSYFCFDADMQQPLHLSLSANNSKSLEDAKRLADNLLDTISLECGASR